MLNSLNQGVSKAVSRMQSSRERGESTERESVRIRESLSGISQAIRAIQDMGIQTASAAEQQSVVSEEINENLVAIQQIVNELSHNLNQSESISSRLAQSGQKMGDLVGHFKI